MENIEENNCVIAEFMGAKLSDGGTLYYLPFSMYGYDSYTNKWRNTNQYHFEDLLYHSSWDWLLVPYKKMRTYVQQEDWNTKDNTGYSCFKNTEKFLKQLDIEFVWYYLVEFIKWYNKQKEE